MQRIAHLIGGESASNPSARLGPVFNPATGEQSAELELAGITTVKEAIRRADAAFSDWSARTPINRARIMFHYKQLLEENKEELAVLVSREHGKTIDDAKGSITRGIEIVEFACGIPQMMKGEYSANVGSGVDSFNTRQALGVCAGITPFNFPAMVPLWMFPVALACGNTFILKPSEKTPSCPLRLVELAHEAGVPTDVLSVVNGDKEAVDTILYDQRVKAVSFVGSTPIAEYIYQTGTTQSKRVQALGGAKNHMIIMPDADVSVVRDALIGSAFGSAGERCMAISVAVCVGDKTADKVRDAISDAARKLHVGPYTDEKSDFGPLSNQVHMNKVMSYIDKGVEEGADLVVDGRNLKLQGYEGGYYVGPCVFDNVTDEMTIYKEEIFGPVLGIVRTESYADALKLVNEHELGNGAALFTNDGGVARHFVEQTKIGMVGVNVPIPVPVAYHSFGGWKRSLFGDHHMHGPEGIRFYTKMKTATVAWPSGKNAGPEFSIPTLS
ncbi:MAG: CoA-acylating methylmalonate-semialdehyde dehydrogenase [Bacteroidetes bacterium]|jgi:malonate-semialdehyde dehydrogenase (acetylating)/methylmalonate-semialdehyde dehydrogenase|nr:CoA-acylating methylmalonate-semialdehyde dehydrogenase [Bacteroidota bacterium]|tara:strand:+ start:4629 stop:6125 length:1497 start_codon:yes stop_codon:yes gene_type:complete